jgi:hypothetical protein
VDDLERDDGWGQSDSGRTGGGGGGRQQVSGGKKSSADDVFNHEF